MSDMRPLDDAIHITFANGERAEARGIGSVQLGGLTGGAFDHITLKDVLYVPEASVNLVSIPLAVRRGIVFDFAEEGCRVSKGGQPCCQHCPGRCILSVQRELQGRPALCR